MTPTKAELIYIILKLLLYHLALSLSKVTLKNGELLIPLLVGVVVKLARGQNMYFTSPLRIVLAIVYVCVLYLRHVRELWVQGHTLLEGWASWMTFDQSKGCEILQYLPTKITILPTVQNTQYIKYFSFLWVMFYILYTHTNYKYLIPHVIIWISPMVLVFMLRIKNIKQFIDMLHYLVISENCF